jgi:diaminohydroxyphosphoribosylaminopyrimidine deaminase / 5-amino-6-(5-phosphoribosylamino)uracil reductase
MTDELYMARCIALARRAGGYNQPNPQVGALLVHNQRIIGEGWHQQYGQAHAEVNAVANVRAEDAILVPESTIYVTLEPCFHFGKTPPCVDLLLRLGIRRVVIGSIDPFALVAGQSIAKLQAAGVSVAVGVLQDEVRQLNRRFFATIANSRPYIVLKFAQSTDRFLSRTGEQTPISDAFTKRLVHRWRAREQAILVGTQTALVDNPRLDNRYFGSRTPLRLVIDRKARLPQTLHLFDKSIPTWVFTNPDDLRQSDSPNLQYIAIAADSNADFIRAMLHYLHQQKIQSILVEGGAMLLQTFIDSDLYDEIRVITANNLYLQSGIAAPSFTNTQLVEQQRLINDTIHIFTPSK